jgi:hypothetical protein
VEKTNCYLIFASEKMSKMRCHYEVLGVARDADQEELKKSYRKMALKVRQYRSSRVCFRFRFLFSQGTFSLLFKFGYVFYLVPQPHNHSWLLASRTVSPASAFRHLASQFGTYRSISVPGTTLYPFYSFRYPTTRMPLSQAFWHLQTLFEG